jgi:site-specific recombinase
MLSFSLILQQLASYGIDTDLVRLRANFDVKGIAQATAAIFLLKFFIGNLAWTRFQRNVACGLNINLCVLCKFFARVRHCDRTKC